VLHAAVWARALEAAKLLVKADELIYKVKQAVARPSCLCTTPALRLLHTQTNSKNTPTNARAPASPKAASGSTGRE
jgi:hypothetical protein